MGLSLAQEKDDNQIKQKKKINLSDLQMVKVKKIKIKNDEKEKDWSKHQLSNLYISDNANQPRISPLDSFVNTDFFSEQLIEIETEQEDVTKPKTNQEEEKE